MEKYTHTLLYKKTKNELSSDDIKYLNAICVKNKSIYMTKLSLLLTPAIFIFCPLILSLVGMFPANLTSFAIMASAGVIIGGSLSISFKAVDVSLKNLGLTKKEWKELKKSGRLKEIVNVLANENLESYQNEKSVISYEDIIDTKQATNYEQLYALERTEEIEQEEAYLIKRLTQIKQEKEELKAVIKSSKSEYDQNSSLEP